jgi:hypothetical protein
MDKKLYLDDYRIEIIDTDNDEVRIFPCKDYDTSLPSYAPNQLSVHQSSCHFKITLPVFFKQKNNYRVIANQWAYDYIANNPVCVFRTKPTHHSGVIRPLIPF